jgi:hypothetical protein
LKGMGSYKLANIQETQTKVKYELLIVGRQFSTGLFGLLFTSKLPVQQGSGLFQDACIMKSLRYVRKVSSSRVEGRRAYCVLEKIQVL